MSSTATPGATDLREEIAAARERRERSERELLQATTAFRGLRAAVEMRRQGVLEGTGGEGGGTAGDRAVDGLVAGFAPLERATLEGTLDALRELAEEYRPTAVDDPEGEHERAFRSAYEPRRETIRSLFGDAYETAAADHVADFEAANDADDDRGVEAALAAVEDAFAAEHLGIAADRASALADAIDAEEPATVDRHVDHYRTVLRTGRERLSESETRLNDLVGRYVEGLPTDADAVLPDLPDADPVLLLPVRLETRFARDEAGDVSALRIRVYPDDVHVDSHERGFAPGERHLGVRFWAHLWWSSHDVPDGELPGVVGESGQVAQAFSRADLDRLPSDPGDRYRAMKARAWSTLVDQVGEERASWVKEATAPQPADAAALLDGPLAPADVPDVEFEALGADAWVQPETWTRTPYARLLPDRWIAFVSDGADVRTVVGSPIREPLVLGPDPDPATAVAEDGEGAGGASASGNGTDAGTDTDGTGGLGADEATAWLVDFERARAAGMGLETPMTDADVPDDGLDVVVLGVKASMSGTDTATALRELLDAHHYTDGLGLLPPGTPTNATEAGPSAFSSTDDAAATLPVECGPSLVARRDVETDGERMARLLAIDPARLGGPEERHVFAHVDGADGTTDADARRMNTALWSATWGYYAHHMLAPGRWIGSNATDGERDRFLDWLGGFREHFVEYVRAGGPFPALRVGRQPYGVLPTTSLRAWGASPLEPDESEGSEEPGEPEGPGEPDGPDGPDAPADPSSDEYDPRAQTYPDVTGVLRAVLSADGPRDAGLLSFWERSTANVPRVDETDTTGDLLGLLGTSASAYGYRGHRLLDATGAREASDPSPPARSFRRHATELTDRIGLDPDTKALLRAFGADAEDLPRVADLLYQPSDPSRRGATSGPLEPLVTADMREQFAALRERPPSLLALWPSSHAGAVDLPTGGSLGGGSGAGDDEPDGSGGDERPSLAAEIERFYAEVSPSGADSLLGALLQYATLQAYASARVRLDRRFGDDPGDSPDRGATVSPWELFPEPGVYEDHDESPLDALEDGVPPALAAHPELDEDATFLDAITAARDVTDPELEIDGQFRAFADALGYFAERDPGTVDLERLFTGTMDLATHRVDGWVTSLATRRLETIRSVQSTADEGGIQVGGYGAVTGLEPSREDPESAGYLHAPSLAQATTAAVLRNGYTTMEGSRRDLLALDLSAERVRTAKRVLDGLRNDQSLGALLGYRFERELHERGLDEYVPEFRRLAPSVAGKLERGDGEPDRERTTDPVDGLALFRRDSGRGPWKGTPESERIPWGEKVDEISPIPLPEKDEDERDYAGLRAALDGLGWTVDAVRDALVAESVHGLVTGRPGQSGASIDALARGEAPPELTFTETPRSGVGVTHRLLVLFDEPGTADAPGDPTEAWPSTRRAAAEPVLDAWFASSLPAPDRIACLCVLDRDDGSGPTPVVVTLADLSVAPIDLVTASGDAGVAQRSTLEERVRYRVSRARGLGGEDELALRFDRPSAWLEAHPVDAFERIDPGDPVPALDELVELGAVLEFARAGRELVSGSRPADATDLALPGTTEGGRVDAAVLADRADAAVRAIEEAKAALDPPLAHLRPGSAEPTEPDGSGTTEGPSTVDRLEVVRDRLRELPGPEALESRAVDVKGVDEPSLFDALEAFAAALDADPVAVGLVDGTVRLEGAADQLIEGNTVATPGTPLELRLDGDGLVRRSTTTVEADGSFAATVDLDGVDAGTAFVLTVRSPGGRLATFDGEVVATATGTPTVDPTPSPPDAAALESYHRLAEGLLALEDVLAALSAALDPVRGTDVDATLSARPWEDLSRLADWRSDWSTDAPAHVRSVLDLDGLRLPGFDPSVTTDGSWAPLAALVPLLSEGANPAAYDADQRGVLSDALDDLLADADRSSWAAALGGLHAAFEHDLRALAAAARNGPTGIDAATFALVEGVRVGLLESAEIVDGSVPLSPNGRPTGGEREALVRQATSVSDALADRAGAAGDTGTVALDPQLARLEAVFGAAFPVLPPFDAANPTELDRALTDAHGRTLEGEDAMAAETWFARAARMREQPSALGQLLTYASALAGPDDAGADGSDDDAGDDGSDAADDTGRDGPAPSRFRLGQLPYREADRWVGLPDAFEGKRPGGRLSLVVHPALGTEGTPHAGLFVDEWTEVVPEPTETTGVTFHHDRPGNRPPQSLLLAVPPDDGGWRLSTLKDILDETFDLARMRTVDTAALEGLGHFLPALTYAETDDRPGTPDRVAVDFDHLEAPEEGE